MARVEDLTNEVEQRLNVDSVRANSRVSFYFISIHMWLRYEGSECACAEVNLRVDALNTLICPGAEGVRATALV